MESLFKIYEAYFPNKKDIRKSKETLINDSEDEISQKTQIEI